MPEKSLLFSVLPLPAKVLLALAPTLARAGVNEFAEMPGSAVMPPDKPPLLSIELVLFCVALTFSTICTVTNRRTAAIVGQRSART